VRAALAGSIAAALATNAALALHIRGREGAFGWPDRGVFHHLRYGLPLTGAQLADAALTRLDRLLVGAFLGAAATGLYSTLYALVSIPNLLNNSLVTVLLPKLTTRAWTSRDTGRMRTSAALAYLAVAVVVTSALTAVGEPAVTSITGAAATGLEGVRLLAALLGLGIAAFGVGRLMSLELYAARRTGIVALIWGGAAAVDIALNLLLLPRHGLFGAGIATLSAYALFLAFVLLAGRRGAGSGLDGDAARVVDAA